MSLCKKWRDSGQVGETCEKARRGTPSLLRLDSTGEVTSVSTHQHRKMCRGKNSFDKSLDRPHNKTLKSVVNKFTMSTVIDTASSYLNTATSYIESFCPYKTSTNLVDSRTSYIPDIDKDPMFQQNNMLRRENHRQGKSPNSCDSFYTTQGYSKTWRKDLLGALQYSVFNRDPHTSATMLKSDKYIPPPVKHRLLRESQWHGLHRDSDITPYNAMLLQRSRQNSKRSQTCESRNLSPTTLENQSSKISEPKSCVANDRVDKARLTPSKCIKANGSVPGEKCDNLQTLIKSDLVDERTMKAERAENISSTPDWFEYENESENEIPIEVNQQALKNSCPKSMSSNMPSVTSSIGIDEDNQERQLHSWYSIENDSEERKQENADLVQLHCVSSQRLCNELVNCAENCKSLAEKQVSSKDNTSERVSDESNFVCEELNSKGKSNLHEKQQEKHCNENERFSILYVRNSHGTKRRSSAQKRSRHRAQKNPAKNCDSKSRNGDAFHPNSSVAFILGLDHDSKERCFSFRIDCDDDDDLDWSSCDENDHSDDIEDCDEMNFFSPLGNFVNFQVTCSVPSPVSPSFHNSVLDRINLEWELNIAVKEADCQRRSQSSKKVQFKEDKQLSTVHHMIAWSFAYQAARKGPWEEIARDRGRFQRRITDGEKLLKPILDVKHRKQVYKDRFA